MRLLRLALIPSLACVLSCSTTTEERAATPANPVQPVLGNPILFPSAIVTSPILATPTATPTPKPSASPTAPAGTQTPAPTPSPTPAQTATPAAPTATPSPTPAAQTPTPAPTATKVATATPQPTAGPTATPTPAAIVGEIHHIRVGFYGINCPGNRPVPNNGAKQLPVGCKGFVTATPKKANGDDVPSHIHGPNIEWDLEYGHNIISIKNSQASTFNKDLTGLRVGTFNYCATVGGVRGCLDGTVIP
jgi:hypothetical protein